MVKIFSNWHIFKFPWESVTNVWWNKYPNPKSLQVDSVDTLDRKMEEDGTLVTRRLIVTSLKTPTWLVALGFPYNAYVLEESRVNPFTREMTMKAQNVTGSDLMVIRETCKYTVSNKNTRHTRYDQTAEITAFVPIVKSKIEEFGLSIQTQNAYKGLDAMEELCERWMKEGVDGFERILNMRLNTVLLMKDLDKLRERINNLRDLNINVQLNLPNIKPTI